ncbi:MAG: hypothetical protein HLUCCA11_23535 [Phormidesmis priestleyi Ana]|uniref:Uncharacterized protein n=1 Tax=Phormidesmis priestleyi Ana TaxID=1666911 RepID=A0A0P7YNT0_9CYAN|nr:MAG: hypothetical protein HLUCCA11_23535 [Phormidesmis priestleyi Ana]
MLRPGLFHSKERAEEIKALTSFALSLSHIIEAVVLI